MVGFDDRDRKSVSRDLESSDEEVRRLAVERVEALSSADVIPSLVECLGDPSWRVRKAAVERLSAWPDTDATAAALIAALADGENPGRRNAAVEALVHHGAPMVRQLIEAAESDDEDVRKFVVDSLGGIGDVRATDCLVALLRDPDPNVRGAAADGLGAIGGEDAERSLCAVAIDESQDSLLRFSALHALAALDVPIRAADLSGVIADPVLRAGGLALLGRVEDDPEALEVLIKALSATARAAREASQRSLLRLLSRADGVESDRIVERVRSAVENSSEIVTNTLERLPDAELSAKLTLIQFLGLLSDKNAVLPVLLEGRDEALSEVALASLESMGDVVDEAIDEAWRDLGIEARRDACVLFGKTQGERSAARLVSALEDRDPLIRTAAARSLGERNLSAGLPQLVRRLECAAVEEDLDGEEERIAVTGALIEIIKASAAADGDQDLADRTVGMLCALLSGASDSVRLAVATVIGRIGRPKDLDVTTLLLKDTSAAVRRAAVEALSQFESEATAEPLRLAIADESPIVRIAAAGALGSSSRAELFDDLCCLARDEDARVRATAVRVLGRRFLVDQDPARRASAMVVMHAARDDEAPVALSVIDAAREIGSEAVTHVVPLLRRPEPEVVREAVRYMGECAADGDLDAIVPLVTHPDWSVRAEAIQVLADRRVRNAAPAIMRRLELEQDEFVRSVTLRALDRLEG